MNTKIPYFSFDKHKIKFLLLEGIHANALEVLSARGYDNVATHSDSLSDTELSAALQDVHFLGIRSRTQLNEQVISKAKKLAAIGCFCIGTDQVDVHAAQRSGIPVFNAPYSNTRSVAELALAEIIMLMRGIPARNAAAHRGDWHKSASGAREIRGKSLGIVGYGHIGSQLGTLAESLGMRVNYYDIEHKLPLGNAAASNSLQQLLADSDVVSLHVPETPQTANMIAAKELAAMRHGGYLINASRGTVVDVQALRDALDSGQISGAAIDVFPAEPTGPGEEFVSPLRGADNVILTPHIGGSTVEAQANIAAEVAGKLIKYSDNGSTLSAVNFPQVVLPDQEGVRRILHIHLNEPGVLQQVNQVFSDNEINIAAQYLQTFESIGYVVMDIESQHIGDLFAGLRAIKSTIRCRVLH